MGVADDNGGGCMNWKELLIPELSLLEIFVRGTITYLVLFFMLRFILKRQTGAVGINDLLVLVLIADAAQNAMSGGYNSITDGLMLVGVIIGWSYVIDWLSHTFPSLADLFRPPPLLLVKDGKMIRKNMRQEYITAEELMSELRQFGIRDVNEVEEMYVESSGEFSVIRKEGEEVEKPSKREGKKKAV